MSTDVPFPTPSKQPCKINPRVASALLAGSLLEFREEVEALKLDKPCCAVRFACLYYVLVLEVDDERSSPDYGAAENAVKTLGIRLMRDMETGKVIGMASPYWDKVVPVDSRFYL